jgi:DnaJ family protein C protein 22
MLKVKFHPDKVKDPAEKQAAQEKFYEVQQACEILSKSEARRKRRNKKSEL